MESVQGLEDSDHTLLRCGDRLLNLAAPRVMGILNITPDSFYDGGHYLSPDKALKRVEQMIAEGAAMIDIGAESSRPYAKSISLQEEIDRIMQLLLPIRSRFDIILSVDTYKPAVMAEAIRLGVDLINDIYALRQEGALEVVASSQVACCLMHMQKTPATMQNNPVYQDIVAEVSDFLLSRAEVCLAKNIASNRILIDPGFGFGKTTSHNLMLLKNLTLLKKLGFPMLVGLSRKTTIGKILNLPVDQRLFGSLSAHVIAAMQGAKIIRTHDIKPTVEALGIVKAVLG